jgi:GxxExxY protein
MQPLRRRDAETDAEKKIGMDEEDDILERFDSGLTESIIGCCIEVHRVLGPGLTEAMYEAALCHEMDLRGRRYQRQVEIPVAYKGKPIGKGIIDLIVDGKVIVELKACESITSVHRAQLICYLKVSRLQLGLLINFNVPVLKDGIRRIIQTN